MDRIKSDHIRDSYINKASSTAKNLFSLNLSVDNLKSLFAIMANFPGFNFMNQMLIYIADKNATKLAGKNAWENIDRHIIDPDKFVAVLRPQIIMTDRGTIRTNENGETMCDSKTSMPVYDKYPQWESNYVPVKLYDIANTSGSGDMSQNNQYNFIDNIRQIGITVSDDDSCISTGQNVFYDVDDNTIYLRKNLPELDKDTALVSILSDLYVSDKCDAQYIKFAKAITRYILLTHYNLTKPAVNTMIPVILSNQDIDIMDAMDQINGYIVGILQILSGYFLTFDDVAILDYMFLSAPELVMLKTQEGYITQSLADKNICKKITAFVDKVMDIDQGMEKRLYDDVLRQKICTYPIYNIKLAPKS